jgi:hypothetical protein
MQGDVVGVFAAMQVSHLHGSKWQQVAASGSKVAASGSAGVEPSDMPGAKARVAEVT